MEITQGQLEKYYTEAAEFINNNFGTYDGYRGGNALSMYVFDKYGLNAVDSTQAMNVLKESLWRLEEW